MGDAVRVYRFAVATAVATFILTIFGGVVSVTESGLACPDWPLCEGKFIPQMVDGKQYEHSHRLVASFVGAMTYGLTALLFKYRRKQRHLLKLGILAAVGVTIQALLGALTVILKLPWPVVSAHLAVATAFFVLMTSIAFLTHPSRAELPRPQRSLMRAILPVAGLVYVQVVAGGVMRHLRAGLACGFDLPLCNGVVWPLDGYVGIQVHMVHRMLGVLAGLAVLGLMLWIWRRPEASRPLKTVAALAGVAVVVQVGLGIMTVLLSRELITINVHSSLGILLMSVMTSMVWLAAPERSRVPKPEPVQVPAGAVEA
jgi:heme A synthase